MVSVWYKLVLIKATTPGLETGTSPVVTKCQCSCDATCLLYPQQAVDTFSIAGKSYFAVVNDLNTK